MVGRVSLKCLFVVIVFFLNANEKESQALKSDNEQINASSKRIEAFYTLPEDAKYREITEEVLASKDTPEESKDAIRTYHRKIFAFKYPSDNLWIKGFISYTPDPDHHPLLILYRWGNGTFALMNPGVIFATYKNYTVISSSLRGGISEGVDEFGGADVNDMQNLIKYTPQIAKELGISIHPSCVFMIGPSRGGLEMFLTLARFPELQKHVNKIVSLSGIVDLHQLLHDRPVDMKGMLETQFGLQKGTKGNQWIAKRDPLNTVPFLSTSLPILIVQGGKDNRIGLGEGQHMVESLKKSGHSVEYWEYPKGDHVIMNNPLIMQQIGHWLESNSPCMHVDNSH